MDTKEKNIYCPQCGTKNISTNTFCMKCGYNLKDPNYKTSTDKINDLDMKLFIGENSNYYMEKFYTIKQSKKEVTWNWSSFFLTGYWFLYRKMYFYGCIILVCLLISAYLPYRFLSLIIQIVIFLSCGMFGNYLYLNYVETEIKNTNQSSSIDKTINFKSKGGTNPAIPIVAAIGIFLALLLLTFMHSIYYLNTFYI